MTEGKQTYSVFFIEEKNLQTAKERTNVFKRKLKLRRSKGVVREPWGPKVNFCVQTKRKYMLSIERQRAVVVAQTLPRAP